MFIMNIIDILSQKVVRVYNNIIVTRAKLLNGNVIQFPPMKAENVVNEITIQWTFVPDELPKY